MRFRGGHLEYDESFVECAVRETLEESGIEIENVRFQFVANVMAWAPKHYVHINMIADWKSGEPQVLEPEKSESWGWYSLDALPSPLFETCTMTIDAYKNHRIIYDIDR
jgi:8-oxo-dGTP diphosphatase